MKKVGLFFGSFNPVHIGHLAIANYCAEFTDLEEIWLIPSPHNPLKDKEELASPEARVHMLQIAVEKRHPKLKICLDELQLPTPSYTYQTLEHLHHKHPNLNFTLIMGEDSLQSFHLWRNFTGIAELARLMVYPRFTSNDNATITSSINYTKVSAPRLDISSTQIREWLANHHDIRMFLPNGVFEFIIQNNLYHK
ncbi:MAG TPA: nicotinate (nicotinamide) nucleotide adenylyltransferase [Williamwhitmania sp.]|nr:nicotinate (nicotinamide) nucleotide adenylyltransferase [Williamwhitmania sp.]